MKRKHPLASKTLWLNAIVLLLVLAEQQLQLLQGVLPPQFYVWLAIGLPVINMILRAVTTAALSRKKPSAIPEAWVPERDSGGGR